jgi:perosamine synthetase
VPKPLIITICGDPGGAKALAAVINLLEADDRLTLLNYTYNQGVTIFQQCNVKKYIFLNEDTIDTALHMFETHTIALLLTATSFNHFNWEKKFILKAQQAQIHSISVLDFWSNYVLRFSDSQGKLTILPDKIAIMDKRAHTEMLNAGFPDKHLIITGQPAFDKLAELRCQFTDGKKNQIRSSLSMQEDVLLVTFASQPLTEMQRLSNQYFGYNEKTVLTSVIQALENISEKYNKRITLLILPHPREKVDDFFIFQSEKINIIGTTVPEHWTTYDYILTSDLVIGMTSALLIETCHLHKIVVSLQPNLTQTNVLPTNEWGLSAYTYEENNITATLEKYLLNETARIDLQKKLKTFSVPSNAANCIAKYIYKVNSMTLLFNKLALTGGSKTIQQTFIRYNPIGNEEIQAAKEVIESGVLSQFIGAWHEDFYGGPKVREFEEACKNYFNVKHAITMNSLTSGLIAMIGAIGIEPGDEVIVSPWTMCASATAIIHWNAIPVFADIEPDTFCLDPHSVEANITNKTKAILAIDIFGQSANIKALLDLAEKYNLKLLSDTAQAPGARYENQYAGTLSHIGGYSLNYHKHIHTGEGGILVTNDDELAERLRLIRNHAEAVVGKKGYTDLANMIGYNFRLGEIECAIGIEQLKKLETFITMQQNNAERLNKGLMNLPGLKTPVVRKNSTHVYYIYPLILDIDQLEIDRETLYKALAAEGVPGLMAGYQNIHLLPMYQKKIAYGTSGFPWNLCEREINYHKGICPTAETLHDKTFLGLALCMYHFSEDDIDQIIEAFQKVWENLSTLKELHYAAASYG